MWEEITTVGTKQEFVHLLARLSTQNDVDRRKLSVGLRYWAKGKCPPHIQDAPNGTEKPDRHALPNPRTEQLQQIRENQMRLVSPAEAQYHQSKNQPTDARFHSSNPPLPRQIDRLVAAVIPKPGQNCKELASATGIPVNSAATTLNTAIRDNLLSRAQVGGVWCYWPPGAAPADEVAPVKLRTDIRRPAAPAEVARADIAAPAALAKADPPENLLVESGPWVAPAHEIQRMLSDTAPPALAAPAGRTVAGFVIEDRPLTPKIDGRTGDLILALDALGLKQTLLITPTHGATHNAREQLFLRAKRRLPSKKFSSQQETDGLRIGRTE
jgi:hypothetical protein